MLAHMLSVRFTHIYIQMNPHNAPHSAHTRSSSCLSLNRSWPPSLNSDQFGSFLNMSHTASAIAGTAHVCPPSEMSSVMLPPDTKKAPGQGWPRAQNRPRGHIPHSRRERINPCQERSGPSISYGSQ